VSFMMKHDSLSKEEEQRAKDLLAKCVFVNASEATHQDEFNEEFVAKCRKGGLDALHLTVSPTGNLETTLRSVCDWHSICDDLGKDKVSIAATTDQIREAKKEGRIALILGLQDISALGAGALAPPDIRILRILNLCRIKIVQITYNMRNFAADGADERTNCGLSKFGIQFVKEMNREGMVIDLSHTGIATTLEVIEVSKDPVMFTHCGVRSLCDHFRNINDEQIKAMAEKGGFMGIPALSVFLCPDGAKGSTLDDYLNHIDYVVKLVGVDHIGVGTDIRDQEKTDSFTTHKQTGRADRGILRRDLRPPAHAALMPRSVRYPKGMTEVDEYRNIVRGLVGRGYSDQEIAKILGENFLRVFKEVCG